MARVIECENGKKHIRDMKMGRRWEVTKRRGRKRKEEEKKDKGKPKLNVPPLRRRKRGDLGQAL